MKVVTLQADPVRLSQVLINLINNAVKFTPPGGHIWLIAERIAESEDHPDQLRIRVRDSGIGIAPERSAEDFRFVHAGRQFARTLSKWARRGSEPRAKPGDAAWRNRGCAQRRARHRERVHCLAAN